MLGFAIVFVALLVRFRRSSIVLMVGGSLLLALVAAMLAFLLGRVFG